MATAARKKEPEPVLVTPEFIAKAHALVDRVLVDHPSTTGILICVAMGKDVDTVSEPENMAQKLRIVDQMFYSLHPEKLGD
jgi:hypothetical protein